jgi:flagellar basal-body rod protein FlgB
LLDNLFGNIPVVEKSLHGLTARQRAISENVANADTPGYKRLEVSFEGSLAKAIKGAKPQAEDGELDLKTSSGRHFSLGPNASADQVQAAMAQVTDETFRNDRNDVDVESEMAKLAETNVRYNTMATLARNKFDGLKSVLREIR